MFGSHLKKDLVDRAITEFYWKMTWEERKHAHQIFRQWESRVDKEAWDYEWLEHLILRYNPDNQYNVKLVNGKTVSCYHDLSQDRFCIKIGFSINPEYIKTITKI